MKDYKGIISYITDLIKKEKDSVNITSEMLANIVNLSINAYYDMDNPNFSSPDQWNKVLISLESYAQNMLNIVDSYLQNQDCHPNFIPVLQAFRSLHADVLASLIIMRTQLSDVDSFTE